jgi:hypothetical protein
MGPFRPLASLTPQLRLVSFSQGMSELGLRIALFPWTGMEERRGRSRPGELSGPGRCPSATRLDGEVAVKPVRSILDPIRTGIFRVMQDPS